MKITKLLALTALLAAATSSQAVVIYWAGSLLGGDGVSWSANNFFDTGTSAASVAIPGGADHVIIDSFALGNPIPTMPTIIGNVGTVDILAPGWGADGELTIIAGGSIAASNFTRLGHDAGNTGTLTMTGGSLDTTILHVGFNGDGIINMSGTAIVNVSGSLGFGETFATGGTGAVNLQDNAMFSVAGDQTAGTWVADGNINAVDAGTSIDVFFNVGANRTEYTVIPEPATLGMVALMGGGILFVRRKFMI